MTTTLLCVCAVVLGAAAQNPVLEATGNSLTLDGFSRIQFILHTNTSKTSYPIAHASELLRNPGFDAAKPTVLYIHGFLENQHADTVALMAKAFLQRGSHNFVLVDWGDYVQPPYTAAQLRVTAAGAAVGGALNRLVEAGLDPNGLWPIGHSLGAQLAGETAKNLDFKLNRITGLDPALPGFTTARTPSLTRDDAVLVDVIHTDASVFGTDTNDATLDFWPNSGRRLQPGCNAVQAESAADAYLFCSHQRSVEFFAASVNAESLFPAVACRSWSSFQLGACLPADNAVVHMGFAAGASNVTGTFYLRTSSLEPFGLGAVGAVPSRVALAEALQG